MTLAPDQPILALLTSAFDVTAHSGSALPTRIRETATSALGDVIGEIVAFDFDGDRYLGCRANRRPSSITVAGPYRRDEDPPSSAPLLDRAAEARLRVALRAATRAMQDLDDERRARLELASQLELLNSAAIAVTGQLTLETVLRRIVDLARELAGARYAALGVPDQHGDMAAFTTSGITPEEEARMAHPPRGRGILGLLLRDPQTLRLSDLTQHPASIGFPEGHPPMKSFLGVPIVTKGQVLGNLYLTEKRFGNEFSEEDARLVEMLARHAAVAIENARLYELLALEQQRLRLIVDQLPEAIVVMEASPERVTIANQQASQLLGWSVETPIPLVDYLEMNVRFDPLGNAMPFERIPIVRALLHGEVISRSEVTLERPDGRRITILMNVAPIWDERRNVVAAVAVFQDITQIKDAEQLKDDFLSLVSHELRTPLTTIQGNAYVLRHDRDALDPDTRDELLADITTEGTRLAMLVENMVQLSNIRAGRFVMETEPVHVRIAIERAIHAASQGVPDRTFQVQTEPNLFADADPIRLDQILRNLLRNAIKYTPAGSPIEVEAHGDDHQIVFSVRDYGPGIDEADIPYIFDRFRRGSHAQRSGTEGMGLGLYLSRHLIEAHGGTIWVERPPDGGTCIKLAIPAVEARD